MFIQQWWPQGRSLGNQDVFYLLGAGTVGGVFLAFRGQTRVRGSYLHWLFLKWLSCKHHRHTKVTYLGVGFPGPHQFLPLKLPWKVHPLKVSWWPGESRVGLVGEWEEACEGRKEHRLERSRMDRDEQREERVPQSIKPPPSFGTPSVQWTRLLLHLLDGQSSSFLTVR